MRWAGKLCRLKERQQWIIAFRVYSGKTSRATSVHIFPEGPYSRERHAGPMTREAGKGMGTRHHLCNLDMKEIWPHGLTCNKPLRHIYLASSRLLPCQTTAVSLCWSNVLKIYTRRRPDSIGQAEEAVELDPMKVLLTRLLI